MLANVCTATSKSPPKLPLTVDGWPIGDDGLGRGTVWNQDDRNQDYTKMCIALAEHVVKVKEDTDKDLALFKALRVTCKVGKEIVPTFVSWIVLDCRLQHKLTVENTRKDSDEFKLICVWLAGSKVASV